MAEKPTYEELERKIKDLEACESYRNRSKEVLRNDDQNYRTIFFDSPLGIFRSTFEGRFLEVNPALAGMLGYDSPEEVMDNIYNIGEQIYVQSEQREEILSNQCESNNILHHINHYKRRDGSVFIANLYLKTICNSEGKPEYLEGIVEDITDRKLTENALKESEKNLRERNQILNGVLEHTHMMAVFLDPQFNFIWVNRAYAETCRHDRSFFQGKNHFDLYPHSENQALFQRAVDTGEPFFVDAKPFEFPDQPERGVTYWDWSLIPVKDNSGKVTGLVFTLAEVTDRILAEERLRKNEENFRTVADFTYDWEYWVNPDGKLQYINPSCERISGYKAEEFKKDPELLRKIIHPSYKSIWDEHISTCQNSRNFDVGNIELRIVTRDGQTRWMGHICQIVHDGQGNWLGRRVSNRDITRRKREEEERRLNEARLEALLKLNDMRSSDSDELSLFALEESARLTGSDIGFINFLSGDEQYVTHAVYTGNTLAQCGLPEETPAFEISECGLWSEAYRQRRPIVMNDYTEEHAAKVGFPSGHPELRRFVSIPIFEEDRVVAVAALGNKKEPYNPGDVRQFRLFMDGLWRIIQRKHVEDVLRASEERFRELAELLPETIYEMDLKGTLTFVNQKAFEKFGYSKEDLASGLNAFDMISEKDRARAKENYGKIIKGETVGITEYEAKRKDETVFPALFHSAAIQKHGEVVGLRGFIIDITQEKQIEAQLKQSHKMKAIGTLAGGIAHDFNNILVIIVGNTELAMFDVPKWSPAQESLKEIREASLRARDLVTQILLFARQKEHTISNIRVEPIARESLKMLRATIPTTVEINQEIQEDLPGVMADAAQIQQIIMNICTNAGQVMEAEGGTLNVKLDLSELNAPTDTSSGRIPEGRYVRIQVQDTGPGISPENKERIFEPFFTTKGVGEGT